MITNYQEIYDRINNVKQGETLEIQLPNDPLDMIIKDSHKFCMGILDNEFHGKTKLSISKAQVMREVQSVYLAGESGIIEGFNTFNFIKPFTVDEFLELLRRAKVKIMSKNWTFLPIEVDDKLSVVMTKTVNKYFPNAQTTHKKFTKNDFVLDYISVYQYGQLHMIDKILECDAKNPYEFNEDFVCDLQIFFTENWNRFHSLNSRYALTEPVKLWDIAKLSQDFLDKSANIILVKDSSNG